MGGVRNVSSGSATHDQKGATGWSEKRTPEEVAALAQEARAIVEWGVKQRRRMMQHGWSRMNPVFLHQVLVPLETWLRQHPTYASPTSVKVLWAAHEHAIRGVIPGNAAGRSKVQQLEAILFAL